MLEMIIQFDAFSERIIAITLEQIRRSTGAMCLCNIKTFFSCKECEHNGDNDTKNNPLNAAMVTKQHLARFITLRGRRFSALLHPARHGELKIIGGEIVPAAQSRRILHAQAGLELVPQLPNFVIAELPKFRTNNKFGILI